MNILFLTLFDFNSINEKGIYPDLLREFTKNGHKVYTISPIERRKNKKTYTVSEHNSMILKLRVGNIQKTNIVEKGISTVLIEPQFIHAIKKYFSDVKFDMVLYSTPPITFLKAIEYVKKRDGAFAYLMLKDIFPQNAVDLGMMKKNGIKSIIYSFFRNKEKRLYDISDKIGCMSPANIDFVLRNNKNVKKERIELCPNCIEVNDLSVEFEKKKQLRSKYGIPDDRIVFVYGGNLGKPQGIDFIIKCLMSQKNNKKAFFLIVGSGTEYYKLERFINKTHQSNVKVMAQLPKEDYDNLVGSCDVGLIFLDYRFTIPNFPSRLLSYMQSKIPVFAVTDINTDIGRIIQNNGFGWWCKSNDVKAFSLLINEITSSDTNEKGLKGFEYLKKEYNVEKQYEIIINKIIINNM